MIQPASHHPAFELRDVRVEYPRAAALGGVSVTINPGERVGFVGPSGAGKTTLLRVLNGTVRATTGEVRVGGEAIHTLSPADLRRLRGRIGFVHQDLSLVPNLRVIQNVLTGRLGSRSLLGSVRSMLFTTKNEAIDIHAILGRVGIAEKLYERTDRLSGGQQQRVAIARALYQQPVALLADEPVSSVDPARAKDTVALLTDIARDQRLTLCMSLHNLELARAHFPRLIGLRHGKIVFDRATSDICDDEFSALYQLDRSELLEGAPSTNGNGNGNGHSRRDRTPNGHASTGGGHV